MEPRFASALEATLEELKGRADVQGVLFFGSVQQGTPTPGSDLDLYALTTGDDAWIEGRWRHGIEVELHFAPPRAWQQRIAQADEVVVHAFATGSLRLDRGGEGQQLVQSARRRWSEGPPALSAEALLRIRYHLTDRLLDLEHSTSLSTTRLLAGELVPAALRAWCAIHRQWTGSPGALLSTLYLHAPSLARLAEEFYREWKRATAIQLADAVLETAGGRLLEYQTPRRPV